MPKSSKTKPTPALSTPKSSTELAPTLGPYVCRWIETNLVHGPGDFLGKPFRLRSDQKARIYRAYELNVDGSRKWRRVVWGLPKGDGKTELCAAISLCEFAGPVAFAGWLPDGRPLAKRRVSPDVPIAAASYDQAGRLYEAAKSQVKEGTLNDLIEVFETEMQFKDGSVGTLYRVAAVAGTNDGRLPSFAAMDETHEWTGRKKRVHLVLQGGVYKRTDAWELEITTAGAVGLDSVAEDSYKLAQSIKSGHSPADDTLIEWLEASTDWDLEDPKQLVAAIREANPAADVLYPLKNLVARYHDPAVPHHEFRRYNLNQWVETTGESWLDEYPKAWALCKGDVEFDTEPADFQHGAVICVDFAQKRDGVGIVTAQMLPDGKIPVYARIWDLDGQRIDVAGAMKYIRDIAEVIPVRAIGYDPKYFELPAQELEDEGFPMLEFPQSGERMVPACLNALEAIREGRVIHNGDEVLASHVRSAVWRESELGPRLSKTRSKNRIDGCIALVMALHFILIPNDPPPPPPASARPNDQTPVNDIFRPTGRLQL